MKTKKNIIYSLWKTNSSIWYNSTFFLSVILWTEHQKHCFFLKCAYQFDRNPKPSIEMQLCIEHCWRAGPCTVYPCRPCFQRRDPGFSSEFEQWSHRIYEVYKRSNYVASFWWKQECKYVWLRRSTGSSGGSRGAVGAMAPPNTWPLWGKWLLKQWYQGTKAKKYSNIACVASFS